ncbi:GNAT family N-acetyltransferase [Sulfitobacter pontiacus]|jgi:GNAT superfamily N-acetyltransferase|uniref:GNAT family N-acetyltransferase n=1 Tax=Sulfitobacter pontiacus TaxID=60137 RepID=UPI0030EB2E22
MIIQKINTDDLDEVVAIHLHAFKGFFLTRMGPSFLRAYYGTALDFDGCIALLARDPKSSEVLGFAVGFHEPQGFYQAFGRLRRRLIPTVMLAALRDPGLVPQIVRNTRRIEYDGQKPKDAVELSSIAVRSSKQGVGGHLLSAFLNRVREKGAYTIALTTDAHGNADVRRFYEKHGFILDRIETRGARQLCHYVRDITKSL